MSSPASPDDQADIPTTDLSASEPVAGELVASELVASELVASVVVPDRADAPISEITERFFKSLLTKVPLDRIEELHLFSPLRQGGVETGIAVIAAREEIVLDPEPIELPLPLAEGPTALEAEPHTSSQHHATDDAADGTSEQDLSEIPGPADEALASVDPDQVDPNYVEPVHVEPVPQADGAEPTAQVIRHTVYTARYRLVQKGPERGKWESEVVAEAEAPLITVEMVVRGVQRRAGEESDTTRFTQAQLARALRLDPGVVR